MRVHACSALQHTAQVLPRTHMSDRVVCHIPERFEIFGEKCRENLKAGREFTPIYIQPANIYIRRVYRILEPRATPT